MRIVITAGGGGHFSPCLAVLESLDQKTEILVIGRKYALEGDDALSLEYQTLLRMKIPFVSLTTGRLQRKFTRHTIPSLFKFPYGFGQAIGVLQSFSPDIILSFGGYVSVPVVLAAYFLRIPVVIHEQTQEAGMANKITSFFAKKVCISWESSRKFFPKAKVVLTGNPVKKYQISNIKYQISNKKLPLIYITGGSTGSHTINVLVEGCIEKLLSQYIVYHQTGDAKQYSDYERLKKLREGLQKPLQDRYILTKFIDPLDVGAVLNHADMVVSRSGINTVTELLFFGKPAILIPLLFSQRNEQVKNAFFLHNLGLAEVASQKKLTSDLLFSLIAQMIAKKEEYKKHAQKAQTMLIKGAAQNIIKVVEAYAKDSKQT